MKFNCRKWRNRTIKFSTSNVVLQIEERSSQLVRNLSSCETKAWKKKIQAWTGFETMTSAMPVQCSTNWAIKPTGTGFQAWIFFSCFLFASCALTARIFLLFYLSSAVQYICFIYLFSTLFLIIRFTFTRKVNWYNCVLKNQNNAKA